MPLHGVFFDYATLRESSLLGDDITTILLLPLPSSLVIILSMRVAGSWMRINTIMIAETLYAQYSTFAPHQQTLANF